VASIFLSIFSLSYKPRPDTEPPVDEVGILQLSWLLAGRKTMELWASKLDAPSIKDLRAAGMFNIRLSEEEEHNGPLLERPSRDRVNRLDSFDESWHVPDCHSSRGFESHTLSHNASKALL